MDNKTLRRIPDSIALDTRIQNATPMVRSVIRLIAVLFDKLGISTAEGLEICYIVNKFLEVEKTEQEAADRHTFN